MNKAKNNNDYIKGTLLVIISAVIFGTTPIIGKVSYLYGSNPIMLTFLRSLLSLPFIAIILKYRKVSFSIDKREALTIMLVGSFGSSLTTLTLYMSYNYIPVGTATTLHFLYPTFVMLISIIIFKHSMTKYKLLSLFLSLIGIITFIDKGNSSGNVGIVLALVSAIAYGFFTISLEHSVLREIDSLKLSFYIGIVISVITFIIGLFSKRMTLDITLTGWICSLLVAILASVIGTTCFQAGVKYIGAESTSMLSLFEPVSSIIVGYLVLKEETSIIKIIGCIIIMISLIIYGKHNKN